MTDDLDWPGAKARRDLDADSELVTWPPRVGARIHFNSGWARTSWTAEVRATVDDEVAVILRSRPAMGRHGYSLLGRIEVHVMTSGKEPSLFYGPLPKELCTLGKGESP